MFLGVLFLTTYTKAQTTDFKLSEYKNPNYLYQALDLNFDFNSGMSLNKTNIKTELTQSNYSINSGAGATYVMFKNSPKAQTELYGSLNLGVGNSGYWYKKADLTESSSNSIGFSEYLYVSGLKRFYNEKQNYFEIDGSVSEYLSGSSYKDEWLGYDSTNHQSSSKGHQITLSPSLSIYIGSGRIEQVQDAVLSMYVLDDLQKLNRVKHIATDEEITTLAQLISTLKHKRFFDTRLQKIAEITAIDSFLQKNGITGTADASYYTSLTDDWNYANNPVRYSGHRFYTGLEGGYTYSSSYNQNKEMINDSITYDKTNTNYDKFVFGVAGVNFEKPVNIKWQRSASIKTTIGVFLHKNSTIDKANSGVDSHNYFGSIPSLKLAADYGFGFYPNSRTWLTFKWWLLSGWDKGKVGRLNKNMSDSQNSFYTYTGPQFHAYYYLSERLRLSLTFNGEFRLNNTKYTTIVIAGNPEKATTSWWNQQVNAALTYSLF